jgi:hypothetical protein
MTDIIPSSQFLPTDTRTPLTAEYLNGIFDLINAGNNEFDVTPLLKSNTEVIWYDSVEETFDPGTITMINATIWDKSALGPGSVSNWACTQAGAFGGLATDDVVTFVPSGTPTIPASGILPIKFTLDVTYDDGSGPVTEEASLYIPVLDKQALLEILDEPAVRFWMPSTQQRLPNAVVQTSRFTALDLTAIPTAYKGTGVTAWSRRWKVLDSVGAEVLPGADYSLVSGSHMGIPDTEFEVRDYTAANQSYYWTTGYTHDVGVGITIAGGVVVNNVRYSPQNAYVPVNSHDIVASERTTLTYWFKLSAAGAEELTIEVNGTDVVIDADALNAGWHSVDVNASFWAGGVFIRYSNETGAADVVVEDSKFVWAYEDATTKYELDFVAEGDYTVELEVTVPLWSTPDLNMTQEIKLSPAYEEVKLPNGGVVNRPDFVTLTNGTESEANTNMPVPFDTGETYLQVTWGIEGSDGSITLTGPVQEAAANTKTVKRNPKSEGRFGKSVETKQVIERTQKGIKETSTTQLYKFTSSLITADYTGQYVYFNNLDTPCKIVGYENSINIVEVPTTYFGVSASWPLQSLDFVLSPAGERAHVNVEWSYQGNTYTRSETVRRTRAAIASTFTRFYDIPATAEVTAHVTIASGLSYAAKYTSAPFTQSFAVPTAPDVDQVTINGTTYGVMVKFPKITGAIGYLCRSYEVWEATEKAERNVFIEQPAASNSLWVMVPVPVDNGRAVSVDLYTVGAGNVLSVATTKAGTGGSLTIDDQGFTYPCGTVEINNADIAAIYRTQSSATSAHDKSLVESTMNVTVHNHDSNIHIKRVKAHITAVPSDALAAIKTKSITSISDYSTTVAGTVKIVSTAHTFSTNDTVAIGGTLYTNGTATITVIDEDEFYFPSTYNINEIDGGTIVQSEVTTGYPLILAVDGIDSFVYVWPEIYGTGYFEYPVDLYVPAKEDIRLTMYYAGWYKYPTETSAVDPETPILKASFMYDYDRNVTIEAKEETPIFKVPVYQTETISAPAAPDTPFAPKS